MALRLAACVAACLAVPAAARVESECEATARGNQEATQGAERSLMQMSTGIASKPRHAVHAPKHKLKKSKPRSHANIASMSWTTNVGQPTHRCTGSRFVSDFSGKYKGMTVQNGLLLTKAKCPSQVSTKPILTQQLSCDKTATGCHMWCAPVWQSHYDSTDWSAFDSRCKDWGGEFRSSDTECGKTSRLFTWARTDVASAHNTLDLTFAIATGCTHWCAPLWVTIYDTNNWAKSFRWCFNRKGDWGVCDKEEFVSTGNWQDRSFKFSEFMQKHGYESKAYALEFAVYAEDELAEVLLKKVELSYVKDVTTTQKPQPEQEKPDVRKCGSKDACGSEERCCRKGDSVVDAKCCPSAWKCCEDTCCPSYYECEVTKFSHACKAPKEERKPPGLCEL